MVQGVGGNSTAGFAVRGPRMLAPRLISEICPTLGGRSDNFEGLSVALITPDVQGQAQTQPRARAQALASSVEQGEGRNGTKAGVTSPLVRILLLSDDNFSARQRTLLFELHASLSDLQACTQHEPVDHTHGMFAMCMHSMSLSAHLHL